MTSQEGIFRIIYDESQNLFENLLEMSADSEWPSNASNCPEEPSRLLIDSLKVYYVYLL